MDNLAQIPLTLCTVKAALAAGTTTTFSTTGATLYCIKGRAYSRAAATNVATPTTDAATGAAFLPVAANQGSVFVFCYDSGASTLRVVQGQVQALDVAGNFILTPQFPGIPDTLCPFGWLVVKAGSTAVGNWVFGTNNLSGVTGLTYSFSDCMTLPDRPVGT
jgi:hypothetical protein